MNPLCKFATSFLNKLNLHTRCVRSGLHMCGLAFSLNSFIPGQVDLSDQGRYRMLCIYNVYTVVRILSQKGVMGCRV